jgi:hypothetical protein
MTQSAHRWSKLRVESGGGHGGAEEMAWLVCGRWSEAYPLVVASSAIAMPGLAEFVCFLRLSPAVGG